MSTGNQNISNVQISRGFVDNTNYYGGAVNTLQGVGAGFTYACLVEMFRGTNTGARFFWGTYRRFIGGGQGIGMDDNRFKMYLTQADGTKLENFVGAAFEPMNLLLGKLVVLHMVWNGTVMNLYINGQTDVTAITPVAGLLFDATMGPTWGVEGSAAKAYAFDGGILGAAYGETALTAAQVAAHALACTDAGDLVQDAGDTFLNRYSVRGLPTAPATLLDLEGAVNLTRTGALSLPSVLQKWSS
jgi:hypothetical protein